MLPDINSYFQGIFSRNFCCCLRGGKCCVFGKENGVTYVCLRCVISSLSVVSPLAYSC